MRSWMRGSAPINSCSSAGGRGSKSATRNTGNCWTPFSEVMPNAYGRRPGATFSKAGAGLWKMDWKTLRRSRNMQKAWIHWALIALIPVMKLAAQIGGGSLVGSVTDPSGAAVSNVKVKAINIATNIVEETVTNEAGYYEFPLLPAGHYRVEAEAAGFQKAASTEFALNSGTRPRLDLTVTIGQLTESVQVTAQTPLVNSTTTDLGVVIDR